jgi:hypothetical protein
MKKYLAILICLSCLATLKASHIAGGKIWYEYAGDSMHPYRYDVYMIIERDVSGVPMSSYLPAQVCITSSCFSTINISMPLLPFTLQPGSDTLAGSYPGSIVTPGQTECLGQMSSVSAESYLVYKQVDLPGKCSDFSFNYSVNARNYTSNLTQVGNFYIEAKLNNVFGPNSSPRFINPAFKSFCVGKNFKWSHEAIEPDGDSIYYELGIPKTGLCGNPTNMTFVTGYSQTSPMTTTNGITLNHRTGLLTFTPAQQEEVIIHINATEYRFDTLLQIYYLVGSSEMDIQVPIVNTCRAEDGKWLTDPNDTLANISPIICGDSIIRIKTSENFIKSSLAKDGSDFAILNSKNVLVPIVSAGINSGGFSSLEASSFWLKLSDTVAYNDTLTLITRVGSDLNTLLNTCSGLLNAGDSVTIIVNTCNTWINQKEYKVSPFEFYPNPAGEYLNIRLPQNTVTEVVIFDIRGRAVIKRKFYDNSNSRIQLNELASGIYTIKAYSNNWSQVSKFQKL